MEKTIACISTPLGRGAIGIIRMSGQNCKEIARRVFSMKNFTFDTIEQRKMYLGNFDLGDNMFECCLMVYFKSPHSYTGEDMIEFQVHGGSIVTQKVLERLLQQGATLAQPGELSRRAFENGKISLDQAEAIVEEINAESEVQLKASLSSGQGSITSQVTVMQDKLTDTLAQIEATLDYPEEDFEDDVKEKIFESINNVKNTLKDILNNSKNAKYIHEGIKIAILGAANVGKSSLLNALAGYERAIVTDIAGTTRDVVDEVINYKGFKFIFFDTAGIRETGDVVEKIGIEKSVSILNECDIVLVMLDSAKPLDEEDKRCLTLAKDKLHIIIANKCDLPRKIAKFDEEIEISALNKKNIDKILDKIYSLVISEVDYNKPVVSNARQLEILRETLNFTQEILDKKHQSMDIISMLIKKVWNNLGKITGKCENEEIIDKIFAKFCLGK